MKIIILGTAPSSLNLAPVDNPEWEVWSCSPGTYHVPKIDRFFELHRWEPGVPWFSEGYVKFLTEFAGPVMMTTRVPEVKNCTLLPHEDLVKKYGPYFFTSSIAWMLAMAIEQKPEKIALYGVDMGTTQEYKDQRLGCQYFASLARAMGIEVGVPPESDLLRPAPLYGVCEQSHVWIKQVARNKELMTRLQTVESEIQAKSEEKHFLNGAIDDQDWNLHSWFGSSDSLGQEYTSPPDVPVLRMIDGERDDLLVMEGLSKEGLLRPDPIKWVPGEGYVAKGYSMEDARQISDLDPNEFGTNTKSKSPPPSPKKP